MSVSKPYTPSPIVEIAFVDRSSVPGIGQWIDISEDCYEARTTRGRTSEFDEFNAGTLTLGAYNDERKFDPLYASAVSADLVDGQAIVKVMAEFTDPVTLYSDDFASAIADFWELRRGTTSISSGKVTGDDFALFSPMFDGSRAIFTVEVPQIAAALGETYVALVSNASSFSSLSGTSYAWAKVENGDLEFRVHTPALASATTPITYNSTTHRWFQIEITASSIVLRTSSNGTSWTTRMTETNATILAAFPTQVRAVIEEVYASGAHAEFDNVSITSTRLPVWYGALEGLQIGYEEGGKGSYVDVTAVDHIDYLSDFVFENTLQQWVEDNISDFPNDWFPFDKINQTGRGFEDERFPSVGATPSQNFRPNVKLETGEPLHPSSLGSVKIPSFTPMASEKLLAAYRAFPTASTIWNYTDTFTVAAWAQFDEPGSFQSAGNQSFYDLWFANLSGFTELDLVGYALRVSVQSGGPGMYIYGVGADLEADTNENFNPVLSFYDGKPHFIMGVRNGTNLKIYFDGVEVASDTDAAATGHSDPKFQSIGQTPALADGALQSPVYRMSDLMIWADDDLTASEALSLYERMRDGWIGTVLTGDAINALLDEMGWSYDFRSIDSGTVYVQLPKELEGENALALLNTVVASEQGRLFIDELGRVVFHDASRKFMEPLETTIQYSFTDTDRDTNPTDVGIIDDSLRLALDDEFKITRAEVTRKGGTTQIAETGDGRYTKTVDGLFLTEDVQALNIAQGLVFRNSQPLPRADAWTVTPEVFTDDWVPVLQLGVGTKVELEFTPNGLGDPVALEMILGLVEHEITDEEWFITFHGTPADNNPYAIFDDGDVGFDEGVFA